MSRLAVTLRRACHHWCVWVAALFLIAAAGPLFAQMSPNPLPTTLAGYAAHLRDLRALAGTCAQKAGACDDSRIGSDDRVTGGPVTFVARYDWLAAALSSAKSKSTADRAQLMQRVEDRIDADLADVQSAPGSQSGSANFAQARARADAILATREFDTNTVPSLRERILAWIYEWLDRLLGHVAAFGARSPWIAPLLEWLLGTVACALLLAWVFRNLQRQRRRMAFEAAQQIEQTEARVRNWLREAEASAARGAFRDAVHCLYWASIAALEGRRFWQPDRSRTPREYLRLLDPASPTSLILRRQTRSFETIWYGLRPASPSDYDSALDLHRQLRAA
ncbi:MAG TPA: DUF4129 domain-containing protein [Acidobacteriaceae bacterium]|jgi:hypothetical protein|nr:DUF4129 domain-containing protein [Acidobacteriaceae bacterium]